MAKKILRACRSYYERKIEQVYSLKKIKRRKYWEEQNQTQIFAKLYCEHTFTNNMLQLTGVKLENMIIHMTAFLCAKKS